MFKLQAYDANGHNIKHRIALTACSIVACNKWGIYLTTSQSDPALSSALTPLLTDSVCFYVVLVPNSGSHDFKG